MPSSVFIPQLKPCFWRPLYYFYYVAYFGSYSKAALALNTTRSSLTRAIKGLEARLKTPLFVRSTRHVSLTAEGLDILGHAKHLLDTLKKIEQLAEKKAFVRTESLHLFVAEPLLGDYWMEALLDFQHNHPQYPITIYPAQNGLVQLSPKQHRIHIRLGFEQSATWVQKPLSGFEGGFYASEGYLEQWGVPQTMEDLLEHRLLLLNATIPGVFEDMNWHASLLQRTVQEGADYVFHTPLHLIKMAEAGFGIMAWIKGHPSLKGRALREILEDVSALQGPQSQAYFAGSTSSFALEAVQTLYLYLRQYSEELSKN
ncbi:MAG: LysR family transcriptional regulator [Gammaproteobacteria bacterium]|nr:LysR family transcriptional regulator [Gammaproteobacteria bacterium]